jgi:hypothetical protein
MRRLPWQLCWKSVCSQGDSQTSLHQPYRAPSWSWASAYSQITWTLFTTNDITDTSDNSYQPVIEILDVNLVPLGSDPLGQLLHANLQMKCGPIVQCRTFQYSEDSRNIWRGTISFDQGKPTNTPSHTSYLLPLLQHPKYYLVQEITLCCIIIAPSQNLTRGEFVRVSVFDIVFKGLGSFQDVIEFCSRNPYRVMDESLYEKCLGPNADGMIEYTIRLV